jgi:tryptophan synthase alpha subunit
LVLKKRIKNELKKLKKKSKQGLVPFVLLFFPFFIFSFADG